MEDSPQGAQKKKSQLLGVVAAVVGGAIGAAAVRGLEPQTAGMLFGGAVAGALCGLLPYFIGKKKSQEKLGSIALLACIVAGVALGLILAIPTAVVFVAVILTRRPALA
jgi:hypothetical protein